MGVSVCVWMERREGGRMCRPLRKNRVCPLLYDQYNATSREMQLYSVVSILVLGII